MTTATRTRKGAKLSATEVEARKAERAARVAAIEAAAEAFELDEDDRAMMRAFTELSAHYSERNALLILAQASEQGLKVRRLSDVGAFGTFKAAGRMVKKGEHASIYIWAPAGSKSAEKTEDVTTTQDGQRIQRFFRLAPLFHISQTEKMPTDDSGLCDRCHGLRGECPCGAM